MKKILAVLILSAVCVAILFAQDAGNAPAATAAVAPAPAPAPKAEEEGVIDPVAPAVEAPATMAEEIPVVVEDVERVAEAFESKDISLF